MTRAELIADRLRDRVWAIMDRVPPLDPGPCYWLEEDSSASYCRRHAIIARGREFDLGAPLVDNDWYRHDDWEGAFWDGIGRTRDGTSDVTERCHVCGETLSYILTDEGVDQELDYWLENPLIQVRDEDVYALDRLSLNVWAEGNRRRLLGVAAAVNQAWRLVR